MKFKFSNVIDKNTESIKNRLVLAERERKKKQEGGEKERNKRKTEKKGNN